MFAREILLQLADNKKLELFVRGNQMTASVARRFVAGETILETIEPVRSLNQANITASLDLLGESVTNVAQVGEVMDTYISLFRQIKNENLDANVSLKLTSLGLNIDETLCEQNMQKLLKAAGSEQFVRIDMESSEFTERTLSLFYRLWNASYRNVGVVVQSYLRRSAEDVEKLIETGARVRLCKGAYKEPESVAFADKSEVDASYIRLMQRLLKDGCYPGIATHDENMINATKSYARDNQIAIDRFEFQMLYGIRRDLQLRLVQEGYRMRVYTPFGKFWYPYLMRRLAERPANLWFVASNMFR